VRTCKAATGAATSCSGPVRKVVLTPKSPLVSGQHYVVAVSGVRDGANRVVSASKSFRAAVRQEETGAGVTPAWQKVNAKPAFGGSYLTSASKGAWVTYGFTGTTVTWYTMTGRTQGVAIVYVDGVRKATVDNSAAATHNRVARTVRGLKKGAHTLAIVVAGKAGARGSHGRNVTVDAVRVGGKTVATPPFAQHWASVRTSHASAGAYAASAQKGSALTMVFRGTSISWTTVRGKGMGQAAVYVDGVRKTIVDNYATATKYGVGRLLKNLSDRQHTLRIVVLGTHHKGGTGNTVAVDRFVVG